MTDLQAVSVSEWLDKHACDDGQGRGECCGRWAVCGGRAVWMGNNGEQSRFGRTLVAVWVGGWRKPLQSVSNYQMETRVHESGHDKRYKYVEMQCQNTDNQGARSCNQETPMERNENPI